MSVGLLPGLCIPGRRSLLCSVTSLPCFAVLWRCAEVVVQDDEGDAKEPRARSASVASPKIGDPLEPALRILALVGQSMDEVRFLGKDDSCDSTLSIYMNYLSMAIIQKQAQILILYYLLKYKSTK